MLGAQDLVVVDLAPTIIINPEMPEVFSALEGDSANQLLQVRYFFFARSP